MLHFFRHIRRSFFQPGKFRTYLAYAFGEIVLIVVGILIAVQIGDWKDERKLEHQRLELIENLKADFQSNIARLQVSIASGQKIVDETLRFLKIAGGDVADVPVEEIRKIRTAGEPRFQPALSAYQTALSTGSIGLIEESSVKELLVDFERLNDRWDRLQQISDEATFSKDGIIRELSDMAGTSSAFQPSDADRYLPKKFELSDEEYREIISRKDFYAIYNTSYSLKAWMISMLERMKKTSEEILTALEAL